MTAAQEAAFRLSTTLPSRKVAARTQVERAPEPAPHKTKRAAAELHARMAPLIAKGWSRARVARVIGCSRATVWRHFPGKK